MAVVAGGPVFICCAEVSHGLDQRKMDTLLLHVTKIIDLGQAGGGYNYFYAWYAIIGHTTALKVLWC